MDEGMREMDEGMRDRTAGACRRLPQRSVAQCRVVLCVCVVGLSCGAACRADRSEVPCLRLSCVSCHVRSARRRAAPVCRAVRCRVPHQSSSEPCAERAELPSCAQPSAAPLDATLRRARVAVQLYALCRCERQYRGLQI